MLVSTILVRKPSGVRAAAGRGALVLIPLIFVSIFFLLPVLVEVGSSIHFPHTSLTEFEAFGNGPAVKRAVINSLTIAFQSSLFAALLGIILLSALATWNNAWRGVILASLLLPFAASELVRIIAWLLVLGPNGPVAEGIGGVFGSAPALVANRIGVLIGLVHVELPFFVLSALPTVMALRKEYAKASTSMGANRLQTLLTVTLPLCLPGIAAAWALAFILGLAYYATPTLLGGTNEQTMLPSLIMSSMFTTANWNQAAALGVLLLSIAVVGALLLGAFGGLRLIYSGVSQGKAARRRGGGRELLRFVYSEPFRRFASIFDRRLVRLGLRIARVGAVAVIILYLLTPALASVPASLGDSTLLRLIPRSLSLRWYGVLFTDHAWASSLWTSVTVSIVAAVAATSLGLCAAVALVRGLTPLRSTYFTLLLLPMIMPLPVIALGLFLMLDQVGMAFTWGSLAVGYTLFGLPYATIVLTAGLQAFDWSLDLAGQSLGARAMVRLRSIWLPILRPTVFVSLLFCFIIAFTELVFALFMRTLDLTTLPVKMWSGLRYSLDPTAAAVSGLTFGVTIGIFVSWYAVRLGARGYRRIVVGVLERRPASEEVPRAGEMPHL